MLHCAGPLLQKVFETVPDTSTTYVIAIRALDGHFVPLVNKFHERYRLCKISQKVGETTDQFVARIRQQASYCKFSDSEQKIIDQMVEKHQNHKV